MAASYQTGSATSPWDLIDKLKVWLLVQGWTQDQHGSPRSHLHKGSIYMHFCAASDSQIWPREALPTTYYHDYLGGYGVGCYMSTGYSAAIDWDVMPGRPIRFGDDTEERGLGCGMNLPASGGDYHFFDDGNDNITVVVERSPGIFCHMGWGPALYEAGQPESFPYFFASSSAYMNTAETYPADRYGLNLSALTPFSHPDEDYSSYGGGQRYIHSNAFARVDAATFSDRWVGNGCRNEGGYGYTGRFMRNNLNLHPNTQGDANEGEYPGHEYIHDRIYQSAFAGGLLLPLHSFVLTDPGARWAPIGYPPTVFWCEAVGNGFSQNDIYAVGGLNYMLFPHFAVLKAA
jgi:hypothetical protein